MGRVPTTLPSPKGRTRRLRTPLRHTMRPRARGVRCPMLRIDPKQRTRLIESIRNSPRGSTKPKPMAGTKKSRASPSASTRPRPNSRDSTEPHATIRDSNSSAYPANGLFAVEGEACGAICGPVRWLGTHRDSVWWSVIVWLNGTHGAGKTTTSALLQPLLSDAQVFDAEKVGETLMDIRPGLRRSAPSRRNRAMRASACWGRWADRIQSRSFRDWLHASGITRRGGWWKRHWWQRPNVRV